MVVGCDIWLILQHVIQLIRSDLTLLQRQETLGLALQLMVPTYDNLIRCTTKGKKACPICRTNTCSLRLSYSKSMYTWCMEGFLQLIILIKPKISEFNVHEVTIGKPRQLTRQEILDDLNDVVNDWEKSP